MNAIRQFSIAAMIVLAASILPIQARADSARAVGTVTEVTSRIGDNSVVILDFDLPTLRQGVGLEIVSATIEWPHSEITEEKTVRYQGFVQVGMDVRNPATRIQSQNLEHALAGEPIFDGVFYPQDHQRTGSGHLRMDVHNVVAELVGSASSHLQLMVSTADMSPSGLAEATQVPVLVVQYGFLGDMKQALGSRE